MRVEIVSHCYRYSRALAYQISSLIHHSCAKVRPMLTVVCASEPDDRLTHELMAWGWRTFRDDGVLGEIRKVVYSLASIWNRTIGRNDLAKHTDADVVWFADCDYVFGPGCLDALAAIDWERTPLIYPRETLIHQNHATGDAYLRRVTGPGLYGIDEREFIPKSENRAIGGIQIVSGALCRQYGYCDSEAKRLKPAGPDCTAFDFRGDTGFRKILAAAGYRWTSADIPHLYRVRQTTTGVVDTL